MDVDWEYLEQVSEFQIMDEDSSVAAGAYDLSQNIPPIYSRSALHAATGDACAEISRRSSADTALNSTHYTTEESVVAGIHPMKRRLRVRPSSAFSVGKMAA